MYHEMLANFRSGYANLLDSKRANQAAKENLAKLHTMPLNEHDLWLVCGNETLVLTALEFEVSMYIEGYLADRFGMCSGYHVCQYLTEYCTDKVDWASLAKQLFVYYGVLVLGFTESNVRKSLLEVLPTEDLERLTQHIANELKLNYG